jgi:hypothetical protein
VLRRRPLLPLRCMAQAHELLLRLLRLLRLLVSRCK